MNAYGLYKHMVFKMPFQLFANFLVKNRNGSDSKKKKPSKTKVVQFFGCQQNTGGMPETKDSLLHARNLRISTFLYCLLTLQFPQGKDKSAR